MILEDTSATTWHGMALVESPVEDRAGHHHPATPPDDRASRHPSVGPGLDSDVELSARNKCIDNKSQQMIGMARERWDWATTAGETDVEARKSLGKCRVFRRVHMAILVGSGNKEDVACMTSFGLSICNYYDRIVTLFSGIVDTGRCRVSKYTVHS